ncbi:PREDICTED: uncharacterized protein LOC108972073 isoform X1 [Bactrocera latifrons]|uniref:uncharacterized protein LOC108972073 isoform X1 n=1 Tax=Bactrocera latifrons TaxID=174628 RepID=UPI0008DCCDBC|nr:PREDICTED: uncharacterized protein LOC108972073 isoform X1 [Bactrocera latifrons]
MVRLSIIAFAVKPRVSLIKFRKGGHARMDRTERLSSVSTVSCRKEWLCNNDSIKRESATRSTAIEDWELPNRYARKPIDQVEMEYINNGGII